MGCMSTNTELTPKILLGSNLCNLNTIMTNPYPPDWGNNETVTSLKGLHDAIEKRKWENGHIKLASFDLKPDDGSTDMVFDVNVRSENHDKPIVIRADDAIEKARITGKGSLSFEGAKNLILHNIDFAYKKSGKKYALRIKRTKDNKAENCKIVDCKFSFDEPDTDMLILDNCQKCVVSKCTFEDKHSSGLFIKIRGADSQCNVIQGCTFSKFEFNGDENAEPIRLGGSEFSGCWFRTKVRYCHFNGLDADAETVSIKSCGNVLEHNKHENCDSNFTIRHGCQNTIANNLFIGKGGIRVHGDDNIIRGNYHKDNNNSEDRKPLIVSNGIFENDPNSIGAFEKPADPKFKDGGQRCKPSGKEGCGHFVYVRAKNNLIEGNVYQDCKGPCVEWGCKDWKWDDKDKNPHKHKHQVWCDDDKHKDKDKLTYELKEYLSPINNTFKNNILMADDNHKDSTLISFACKQPKSMSKEEYAKSKDTLTKQNKEKAIKENTFEPNNRWYDKAKLGEIPQGPELRVDEKDAIREPDAGPEAMPAALEAADPDPDTDCKVL